MYDQIKMSSFTLTHYTILSISSKNIKLASGLGAVMNVWHINDE